MTTFQRPEETVLPRPPPETLLHQPVDWLWRCEDPYQPIDWDVVAVLGGGGAMANCGLCAPPVTPTPSVSHLLRPPL